MMTPDKADIDPVHAIPRVTPCWSWRDYRGAWAVRWCVRRHSYSVPPGVYAMNAPTAESPILVTANYKLSFDHLRRVLEGISAWILVLDTKSVNVWCAAGKGTFGTEELVSRLHETQMVQRVSHRVVVVPQLGAPGVAAHDVQRRTGFKVVYGPVYARDLPAFLRAGLKAEPQMRRIGFSLGERLAVAPVEIVQRLIPALVVLFLLLLLSGLSSQGYTVDLDQWPWMALIVGGNFITGLFLFPALLPWLPGRSFSLKGASAGIVLGVTLFALLPFGSYERLSIGILSMAACSFLGLMFTGCTPYTSASGVRSEMRWALPVQAVFALIGLFGWLVSRVV